MCGILYVKNKNGRAGKTAVKRFNKQKSRGVLGFGYITIDDNKISSLKRFEKEGEMVNSLKRENSKEILLHHRYPTSTPNFVEATHPIVVDSDLLENKYYVIHNGVISNDDELKKEHEELGFVYSTGIIEETSYKFANSDRIELKETKTMFNDSEVFAIDLALYLENKQEKIKSKGSIAFICVETDKNDFVKKIHYGHNDKNPLVLEENNQIFCLKSMGTGTSLKSDILFTKDLHNNDLIENDVNIGDDFRYKYDPSQYKKTSFGFSDDRGDDYEDYDYEKLDKNLDKYFDHPTEGLNNSEQKIIDTMDELYDEIDNLRAEKVQAISDLNIFRAEMENGFADCNEQDNIDYLNLLVEELQEIEDCIKDKEEQLSYYE